MSEIKNLGQLIQHLATKAGIKADDPNLVNILSNAELTKVTVHSDLVTAIDENLLHIEAALDQHPKVRNKYTAEVLGPIDARMAALMDELEFDDATKTELGGIRSSYKRFETLTGKLKETLAKKAGATKDKDKEALQQQIDALQEQLRAAKKSVDDAKKEYENKLLDDRKDFRLRNLLSGKKTTLDTLPEDVRFGTLMGIVNKKLQAQGAEIVFDEKGELQLMKEGSKLYGANHTLITLDSLIDAELAQNKLLVVNPEASSGAGGSQQQNQGGGQQSKVIDGTPEGQINGTNQSVASMNLAAAAALGDPQN